jgi:hypothetical protein
MWSNTLWLVRKECKYNWPAFLFTILIVVVLGFFTASSLINLSLKFGIIPYGPSSFLMFSLMWFVLGKCRMLFVAQAPYL